MRSRERGFVITLGIVILFTVIVIGLFVGISSVRDAWFRKDAYDTSVDVYVLDKNGKVLGKAVDFDEHEAPLVPFVDYSIPDLGYTVPNTGGEPANYRVLVGVRDDRFTSRERIYYPDTQALNCTGTPCMFEPSTESVVNTEGGVITINSVGVDEIAGTGGVSYQLGTQAGGGPGTIYNYGVGATDGVIPGRLYRQTNIECPLNIPAEPTENVYITYWQSQRVVESGGGAATTPPCYKYLVAEPAGEETVAIKCQPGSVVHTGNPQSDACLGEDEVTEPPFCRTVFDTPGDDTTHRCATSSDPNWGGAGLGACPIPDWTLQPPNNNSGWCCPPGQGTGGGAGTCQQASKNYFTVQEGTFLQAEDVINPHTGNNVLDDVVPPFSVNLPINPDDWQTVAPNGEGTP